MPSPEASTELRERLAELSDLGSATSLLGWDQQVMMPAAGGAARGRVLSTMEKLAHERLTDPRLGELLADPAPADAEIAAVVRRDHERATRVPTELATEMARASADGYQVWLDAREANDFDVFAPALERHVALARRYSACFPAAEHPYDPLLDQFEEGATTATTRALFERLAAGLVPLLSEIARRPEPAKLPGELAIGAQRETGLEMITAMGFDASAWRLDDAIHPFAVSLTQTDVRVTARFDERTPTGLFALLHEVGHGLYEHGVDPALAGTTVDSGTSLGVHESQSRLWENQVGRSAAFWTHWLTVLRERCPLTLRDVSLERFLRAINVVKPTLIRVEADEVTYCLHVILRFELEVALLEGSLEVADLREAWAAKTKQLLGLEVPDDVRGVLQDIHWSQGVIGYFPTYAIGNVLAAQLWERAQEEIDGLDERIATADYSALREWLREKVHRHGRLLTPVQIAQHAVGGPLDPQPMLDQLRAKYTELYGL